MGRDLKVQLGARVPAEVRERAVAAAKAADVSLNEWVERALNQAVGIPVVVDETVPPGTVELRDGDQTAATIIGLTTAGKPDPTSRVARPFDSNCRQATLHWKYGPGRPCRYCEGEVYP